MPDRWLTPTSWSELHESYMYKVEKGCMNYHVSRLRNWISIERSHHDCRLRRNEKEEIGNVPSRLDATGS